MRINSTEAAIQKYKEEAEEVVDSSEKSNVRIKKHEDEGRKLRAQLKQERSKKMKMLQELWFLDAETGFFQREVRYNDKVEKALAENRRQKEANAKKD